MIRLISLRVSLFIREDLLSAVQMALRGDLSKSLTKSCSRDLELCEGLY